MAKRTKKPTPEQEAMSNAAKLMRSKVKKSSVVKAGKAGGAARAAALTPEQRREIASAGAKAMHAKRKAEKELQQSGK